MKILTPLQEEFIYTFSKSPLKNRFFLTGGTALAAFYLEHRYSDDMDFFTEVKIFHYEKIRELTERVRHK